MYHTMSVLLCYRQESTEFCPSINQTGEIEKKFGMRVVKTVELDADFYKSHLLFFSFFKVFEASG